MTGTHPDDRRIVADGGNAHVTRTAVADGVVTREVDGEDMDMIRVPISSTRPDREGDRFDKAALEEMADQIRATNPMVFDNHGLAGGFMEAIPYDSRETIGAQMDAELESAEDGEWDLYALVNPDGTHVEGERMARQVRDEGQPIKFSVGFRVKGYDERAEVEADYEGDGRVFTAADLMETSRVGIPANPDASVTQSVAAKDLPGYANHPLVQLMGGAQPGDERSADGAFTAKGATPTDTHEGGSCDADADCPDGKVCVDGECVDESEASASIAQVNRVAEEVAELRELVETLADDDEDDEDGDDDEDDEDDEEDNSDATGAEESDADLPDEVQDELDEWREEQADLRAEIEELREGGLERGASKTTDTDATRDARPDETDADDADDEESEDKNAGTGLLG